jgi:uncharacterized membrane protein YedE/YeeE
LIVFPLDAARYDRAMTYWPFWLGAIALAGTALLHWLLVGQLMSVSSRFSAIVDSLRGEAPARPDGISTHVLFLVGLVLGGFASAALAGTFAPSFFEVGTVFAHTFGTSPAASVVVMTLGGALVGFGTRMASGCTSGHGLCGVARFQPGSLLATCAFFGTGVVFSLLVGGR